MNQLEQTLDSREVAEMVGKEHKELLRDIRRYCEQFSQSKIALPDFFIESEYENRGKQYPCYKVTKKGCEFIANKLTGTKGTEFTAKYVNRFHDMAETIANGFDLSSLSPQLQLLISMETEQKRQAKELESVKTDMQDMRDIISLNPNSWREDAKNLITRIAKAMGGNEYIREVNQEVYKLLDSRMGVDLSVRLTNMRRRMADEGVCKSKRDKLNKVDVIATDKKLIEGYLIIIKEMAVKYGIA